MRRAESMPVKIHNDIAVAAIILLSAALLTGCAAMAVSPVTGALFTEVKGPHSATASDASFSKMGTATCISYLGLIATGDASIETAAKSAGITKIHHVDYQSKNILGLYAEFTIVVYGE